MGTSKGKRETESQSTRPELVLQHCLEAMNRVMDNARAALLQQVAEVKRQAKETEAAAVVQQGLVQLAAMIDALIR